MKNTLFLIGVLFCSFFINAQDLTVGLIKDDKSQKNMNPNIPKPGLFQSIEDPNFDTTIRRITDAGNGKVIAPMYNTVQAWNADETLMIVYQVGSFNNGNGGHLLLDGKTYEFIKKLTIVPDDVEQIFWDTLNPDRLVYVDDRTDALTEYFVSTDSSNVLADLRALSGCVDIAFGNDVQMPSRDGNIYSFRCGSEKAFYYNVRTQKLVQFEIDKIGFTAPMPAPSGTNFYHNKKVYDEDGKEKFTLNLEKGSEHACLGQLANGNDAHFSVNFGATGCLGNLVAIDLETGDCTQIISRDKGYQYSLSETHMSALAHANSQSGWVAASFVGYDKDGQSLLDQELIIARADPGDPAVYRIGHHRSDESEFSYWGEPHPVISPSGTRVLFGSDWSGSDDGKSIDSYVVELPAYNSATLSTGITNKVNQPTGFVPNPFSSQTTLQLTEAVSSPFTITIYSLDGKIVKSQDYQPAQSAVISSDGLLGGMYLYNVSSGNSVLDSGKLIVK